jgi:hypothetical protein
LINKEEYKNVRLNVAVQQKKNKKPWHINAEGGAAFRRPLTICWWI